MTQVVTNELIYEVLKKIQADLADIRRGLRETKAELEEQITRTHSKFMKLSAT